MKKSASCYIAHAGRSPRKQNSEVCGRRRRGVACSGDAFPWRRLTEAAAAAG